MLQSGSLKDSELMFIEQLFHDDFMCAALYSVPGFVLLKANQSYFKRSGVPGGAEELLNQVVSTGKILNVEEKKIAGTDGDTYWDYTFVPVFGDHALTYIFELSRDVTERVRERHLKEARDTELRRSKERLEAILNNMSDQLMIIRKDGYFELFNRAAKELFDPIYGVTEKLGGSNRKAEYYDMDNNRVSMEELPASRVIQGESFSGYRFKIKHKDWTVIEATGTPVYDDNGDVLYGILCCRDITELVQYEEKLIEQNRLQSAIIENMHDAMAVFDGEGKISILNAKARYLYPQYDRRTSVNTVHNGYECYDLNSKLIPADSLPTCRAFRGETVKNEKLIIKRDKVTHIMEINAVPILDHEQKLISAIVSHHDITDNYRYQLMLQNKNELLLSTFEKLQNIIENTDGYIISVDADFRIVLLNTTAKEYYREAYQEELSSGNSLEDIGHPILRSRMLEMCRKALRDGKYELDIRVYNTEKVVCYTVNPVYVNDKPVEIIMFGKDMTERIRAENEIVKLNASLENLVRERTKELQGSVDELQNFAAAVSHEMKTPLREIEYYAGELTRPNSRFSAQQSAEKVVAICRRQAEVIDKLYQFSSSTKAEMKREPIQLKKMIIAIFEALRSSMGLRHAVIDFETGLPRISADKVLLQQALSNIIANALKFSSTRDVPKLIVGCRAEKDEYVFYFSDNGVGFDAEFAGKLFTIFERLHTREAFEGSGIGLATVRNIIRRHGGRTWMEGEENAGATLYFSLPMTC